MNQRQKRSVCATPNGKQLLFTAKGSSENGRLTYEAIATKLHIDAKTVARFFRGEWVDKENAYSIIKLLGLSNEDVLSSEDALVGETIESIEEQSANSKRAEELIENLEAVLSELKQSEEDSLAAMEWLKANRHTLAREAAEFALEGSSGNTYDNTDENQPDLEQFSQEIRKYLQLVYYCLEEGSWELIDGAVQQSLIPIDRDIASYVAALTFIRDHKINRNLPSNSAQTIALCLNYLVTILPWRF